MYHTGQACQTWLEDMVVAPGEQQQLLNVQRIWWLLESKNGNRTWQGAGERKCSECKKSKCDHCTKNLKNVKKILMKNLCPSSASVVLLILLFLFILFLGPNPKSVFCFTTCAVFLVLCSVLKNFTVLLKAAGLLRMCLRCY